MGIFEGNQDFKERRERREFGAFGFIADFVRKKNKRMANFGGLKPPPYWPYAWAGAV